MFSTEMGFRVAYEDCSKVNFGIILAAFEPLNGILTAFQKDFLPLFKSEFRSSLPDYRKSIAQFHDELLSDLKKTPAYLNYESSSTTLLFDSLDSSLNASDLLKKTQNFRISRQNIMNRLYSEIIDPLSLPSADPQNESGEEFSQELKWLKHYDFTGIDYALNSFLLEHKELYLIENGNKVFVYVDLRSANFNVLRLVNPEIVLGAENWEELSKR
jgi:hypothetical protein